jgi:outer membrane receptor for ferrienterochelin and colicins
VAELEDESPMPVAAVTKEQIRDTGYEQVADVLSEIPGIITHGQSYGVGLVGAEQINGIDSKETLILQDGLPIPGGSGIQSGYIDLNQQDVGKFERVEVVEGAASSLYGTDAIGGVINLITREPEHPFDLDANLSEGSLGTVDGRLALGSKWKNLTAFTDLESHHVDSFSLLRNDPTTAGANENRQDILLKLRYQFNPRAALGFTSSAYQDQLSGRTADAGPVLTRLGSNESTQTFALTGDFMPTDATTLQARLYSSRYNQNSHSNLLLNGTEGGAFDQGNLNENYHRADATVGQQWGSRQFLHGGVEWAQDLTGAITGWWAATQDNKSRRMTCDRIQAFRNLTVTLGGRYQHHSSYGSHVVPKAGLVYRVNDHLLLRASFGQGFRAPNLGELYYHLLHLEYGYQVIGNPGLRPETSKATRQAGLSARTVSG